jgi:3-oxoacyl-[acyl-carrier-protein] synthase II
MTGHLLGAAGGIEAVASILSIRNNFLPPTIHYKTPDPECDLNYVPNSAVEKDIQYAMSNTFGFGGHNAVVIFKSFEN